MAWAEANGRYCGCKHASDRLHDLNQHVASGLRLVNIDKKVKQLRLVSILLCGEGF